MQPSIFVTGGTGFLGAHLLRTLCAAGYTRIRALRRPSSRMDLINDLVDRIEWVEGDLLNGFLLEDALQGVDWVFHSAALISFQKRDWALMRQVNGEGTELLVNACLYNAVKKLVYVSSIAALGRNKPEQVVDEKSNWNNGPFNTGYGISKFLAEQEVWRASAEGLSVAVVNPSLILGPGPWHEGTGQFFQKIYQGLRFYPRGLASVVDVRDVARMCLQLMESEVEGERFLATAENLTYFDLFEKMANALQVPAPQVKIQPWMGELAWRGSALWAIIQGKNPLLSKENIRQSALHFRYSNQKSIEQLGFQYTPLEQTILDTAAAFLAQR
jgi:dihydroflavonol-4-reductase